MNRHADVTPPGAAAQTEATRRTTVAIVLMAGFPLRALNDARALLPGGLDAALLCLDLLEAERTQNGPGQDHAPRASRSRTAAAASRATGIPRETARRLLAGLVRDGRVTGGCGAGYQLVALGRESLARNGNGAILTDFVCTVFAVHAAIHSTSIEFDAILAHCPWHAALATRRDTGVASMHSVDTRAVAAMLRDAPGPVRERCSAVADSYLCQHMTRLQRAFDGDFILPLLIGEIGHRNISILESARPGADRLSRFKDVLPEDLDGKPRDHSELPYLPVNTYSLAMTMGLPESTVRRKVRRLIDRGWVADKRRGGLTVLSAEVRKRTMALDAASLAGMEAAYHELLAAGLQQ